LKFGLHDASCVFENGCGALAAVHKYKQIVAKLIELILSSWINPGWVAGSKSLGTRDLITLLTSDEQTACLVKALTLSHPSEFLAQQITVVDLPGTNVLNSRHLEVAHTEVMRGDMAIVIIDGSQQLSDSLATFLEEALHDNIHRCVFVMTRMDYHPDHATRESVSRNLKRRLSERFELEHPRILSASPKAVTDALAGVIPGNPQDQDAAVYWQTNFEQLKTQVTRILEAEHSVVIAERLVRLMNTLFAPLQESMLALQKEHENRWKQVRQSQIQDLDLFVLQRGSEADATVNNALNASLKTLDDEIKNVVRRTRTTIYSGVYNASNWNLLKAYLESGTSADLNQAQREISKLVTAQTESLEAEAQLAATSIDEAFKKVYRRIQSVKFDLGQGITGQFALNYDASNIALSAAALNARLDSKANDNALKAAAVGAAIGSIIPGLGTLTGALIGGAVGSWLGHSVSHGELSKRKDLVWEQLASQLDTRLQTMQTESSIGLKNAALTLKNSLRQNLTAHRQRYEHAVEDLRQQREKERAEINKARTEIELYIAGLNERLAALEEYQRLLRSQYYAEL